MRAGICNPDHAPTSPRECSVAYIRDLELTVKDLRAEIVEVLAGNIRIGELRAYVARIDLVLSGDPVSIERRPSGAIGAYGGIQPTGSPNQDRSWA